MFETEQFVEWFSNPFSFWFFPFFREITHIVGFDNITGLLINTCEIKCCWKSAEVKTRSSLTTFFSFFNPYEIRINIVKRKPFTSFYIARTISYYVNYSVCCYCGNRIQTDVKKTSLKIVVNLFLGCIHAKITPQVKTFWWTHFLSTNIWCFFFVFSPFRYICILMRVKSFDKVDCYHRVETDRLQMSKNTKNTK